MEHLPQIIVSPLQNDFYKASMPQCIKHQHAKKITTWAFKCRTKGVFFTKEMVEEIKYQVDLYCTIRYTEEELEWLKKVTKILGSTESWIKYDYIDDLRFWHPERKNIEISTDSPCGLKVRFKGPAANVSPYETPIMAIICAVYYMMGGAGPYEQVVEDYKQQVERDIKRIKSGEIVIGPFSEFGFRRAGSPEMHDYCIRRYTEEKVPGFIGTSNMYLAKKYNTKPMGTMAHEFCMLVGQGYPEYNPAYSNKYMLESWVKEYGTENGIALTDTITTDAFLLDFTKQYATLFKGVRHDSADPFEWGEKMIAHYEKLGIDPHTKTLLFSDSLSLERAAEIYAYFKDKAGVAFGIGGALSSPKGKELNIVIKPVEVDGKPICKLSDCEGKNMCEDPEYIDFLKRTINWRMTH